MIEENGIHRGLAPLDIPFVPWKDLRSWLTHPLRRFAAAALEARTESLLRDELDRYLQADSQFYLVAARLLVAIRDALWLDSQPEPRRYSPQAASALRSHIRYFEHDFFSLLIHGRILCDRALPLLRACEPSAPISFTSFQDHRKRILRGPCLPPSLTRWEAYVRDSTDWFPLLKDLRDDFVVHQGPKHMLHFGQRTNHDIEIVLFVPVDPQSATALANIRAISLSPRALILAMRALMTEIAHTATAAAKA